MKNIGEYCPRLNNQFVRCLSRVLNNISIQLIIIIALINIELYLHRYNVYLFVLTIVMVGVVNVICYPLYETFLITQLGNKLYSYINNINLPSLRDQFLLDYFRLKNKILANHNLSVLKTAYLNLMSSLLIAINSETELNLFALIQVDFQQINRIIIKMLWVQNFIPKNLSQYYAELIDYRDNIEKIIMEVMPVLSNSSSKFTLLVASIDEITASIDDV